MTILPPVHDQIKNLSLPDLRKHQSGSLPQRNAEKFSNLASRTPLELVNALADFAHLGQTTDNTNAVQFRRQLCRLSGAVDDKDIVDFQPELTEVEGNINFPHKQVIFLKPIRATGQSVIQAPVIIWDSGSEISVARPSLSFPEKLLIKTIYKDTYTEDKAQSDLVTFMNLVDKNKLQFGITFVSEVLFESTICNAVKEKMKSL